MEDETDHLRRNSRAHTTIESSLLSTNPPLKFGSNATPKLKRNKELRKSIYGPRKSSSGRGKRISNSFEATGVLCEFYIPFNGSSAETFIRFYQINHITLYPIAVFTSTSTSTFQIPSVSDNYLFGVLSVHLPHQHLLHHNSLLLPPNHRHHHLYLHCQLKPFKY